MGGVGTGAVVARTQKRWGPRVWGQKGEGPEGWGAHNLALFFSLRPKISHFSLSRKFRSFFPLWGSSRGILVFEAPGRSNTKFPRLRWGAHRPCPRKNPQLDHREGHQWDRLRIFHERGQTFDDIDLEEFLHRFQVAQFV